MRAAYKRLAILPQGGPALVTADHTRVKISRARKDGTRKVTSQGEAGGEVMFWLRKSVTQRPDPSVLPDDSKLIAAAVQALRDHFG